MGLLGKVFGLEKKGKISLTVDKPSYIAGELVVGAINITVLEPIECEAVVLKATGKEKVKWAEQRTETDADGHSRQTTHHHSKEHEFFKQKMVICSIPNTYMPGTYTYPFEYQLPPDLPGVFEIEDYSGGLVRDITCRISYKLKATLDVNGFFAKDLKANCHLTVHEQLTQTIQPGHDSTSQNVNFLCCFNKGTCHLDVAMDKNVYLAGETAQVSCKINNGSQVDITNMRCKLVQAISFKAHGHNETFTRELCRQTFPGVPAGAVMEQPQPLPLVPNVHEKAIINPSTSGRLITCSYHVDVECNIPWCPDVHLRLPLTVIAPMLVMAPIPAMPFPEPM